jgi:heme-degrading monooxygenase HmoA
MPELGSLPGFLGAHLSCRLLEGEIEFVVLTRWRSWEAIHAFAGEDIGCAVVEPGAKAALSRFDQTVQHYEVLEEVVV